MNYNFDPELAEFAATVSGDMSAMLPGIDLGDPVAAREAVNAMLAAMNSSADTSELKVEDRMIRGPEDVQVRIYTPRNYNYGPLPGLLYIHGGGFFVGSIDTEHAFSATIAAHVGIIVISVEYRLAPEDPFPAGLEDCYATLNWMYTDALELNIDVNRIGVSGQSAGGGLAAALALLTRDRGGPSLCFQLLNIPELDDRLETTSMRTFIDTPMFNRPSAEESWTYYLGECTKPGSPDVSPYAAPARAIDLSGLPPTYIITMEFDPLRDEGIIYAMRLLEAGVSVELHTYPGTFHGCSIVAAASVSQRIESEMLDSLRRGLHVQLKETGNMKASIT